eukprot:820182_1
MATSLTTYSHNTSNKNVHSNIVKKLPYESNSNSTSDKSIKNNKLHQRTKSSSYSSKSLSVNDSDSDSDSNYCLEINEENKHKPKYKPKHKKSKANRLSRSQSHSHHPENPISPRTKQILRMRSKTIEHKRKETQLQYEEYNNNIQYAVNNIINKMPPRQPMISESKSTPLILISQSAPSSPFITGISTNQMYGSHSVHNSNHSGQNSYHSGQNSYHSSHNSYHLEQPQMIVNTMGLPQSNTQVIEESDLTYNIYNQTPSSSSHNNMLMVNNTYSPYRHHYNDHSGSYISHGSHVSRMSNVSLGG